MMKKMMVFLVAGVILVSCQSGSNVKVENDDFLGKTVAKTKLMAFSEKLGGHLILTMTRDINKESVSPILTDFKLTLPASFKPQTDHIYLKADDQVTEIGILNQSSVIQKDVKVSQNNNTGFQNNSFSGNQLNVSESSYLVISGGFQISQENYDAIKNAKEIRVRFDCGSNNVVFNLTQKKDRLIDLIDIKS
jgi:hypothetical protein